MILCPLCFLCLLGNAVALWCSPVAALCRLGNKMAFWCSPTANKSLLGNKFALECAPNSDAKKNLCAPSRKFAQSPQNPYLVIKLITNKKYFNNDKQHPHRNLCVPVAACRNRWSLRKRLYLTWEHSQAAPGFQILRCPCIF